MSNFSSLGHHLHLRFTSHQPMFAEMRTIVHNCVVGHMVSLLLFELSALHLHSVTWCHASIARWPCSQENSCRLCRACPCTKPSSRGSQRPESQCGPSDREQATSSHALVTSNFKEKPAASPTFRLAWLPSTSTTRLTHLASRGPSNTCGTA